jgi:hypothetical protein
MEEAGQKKKSFSVDEGSMLRNVGIYHTTRCHILEQWASTANPRTHWILLRIFFLRFPPNVSYTAIAAQMFL